MDRKNWNWVQFKRKHQERVQTVSNFKEKHQERVQGPSSTWLSGRNVGKNAHSLTNGKQQPTAERLPKTKRNTHVADILAKDLHEEQKKALAKAMLGHLGAKGVAAFLQAEEPVAFQEKTKAHYAQQKEASVQEMADAKAVNQLLRAVEGPDQKHGGFKIGEAMPPSFHLKPITVTACTADLNWAMFPINTLPNLGILVERATTKPKEFKLDSILKETHQGKVQTGSKF